MKLLLKWILMAVSIVAASAICHAFGLGFETKLHDFKDAIVLLVGVAVLGLLNATLGRIIKFLTLPLTCLTLGFFALVVNAAIFYAAAELGLGFDIADGTTGKKAVTAFVASILVSVINGILGVFLPDEDKDD